MLTKPRAPRSARGQLLFGAGSGGGVAVGIGSCLDDVAAEGEAVDDGRAENSDGSGVSGGHRAAGSHHQHQRVIKQPVLMVATSKTPSAAALDKGIECPDGSRRTFGAREAAPPSALWKAGMSEGHRLPALERTRGNPRLPLPATKELGRLRRGDHTSHIKRDRPHLESDLGDGRARPVVAYGRLGLGGGMRAVRRRRGAGKGLVGSPCRRGVDAGRQGECLEPVVSVHQPQLSSVPGRTRVLDAGRTRRRERAGGVHLLRRRRTGGLPYVPGLEQVPSPEARPRPRPRHPERCRSRRRAGRACDGPRCGESPVAAFVHRNFGTSR